MNQFLPLHDGGVWALMVFGGAIHLICVICGKRFFHDNATQQSVARHSRQPRPVPAPTAASHAGGFHHRHDAHGGACIVRIRIRRAEELFHAAHRLRGGVRSGQGHAQFRRRSLVRTHRAQEGVAAGLGGGTAHSPAGLLCAVVELDRCCHGAARHQPGLDLVDDANLQAGHHPRRPARPDHRPQRILRLCRAGAGGHHHRVPGDHAGAAQRTAAVRHDDHPARHAAHPVVGQGHAALGEERGGKAQGRL